MSTHAGAGAKFDKGKIPVHSVTVYFPNAVQQVAKVIAHGEKLHGYNTWHTIPDPQRRYAEAQARHELELCLGNAYDEDSELHHLAHAAWNALARLELAMRQQEAHHG